MATVVIVHAAEDALPARALAEKLSRSGVTPVFDTPAGPELREAIRKAAIVLALWSPRSNTQFDLIGEAQFAHDSGAPLVHALMQNAPAPPAFAQSPAIDLTGWRGEDEFPPWRELAATLLGAAGVERTPAAATPFFNPAAPAPTQRVVPIDTRAAREPEVETLAPHAHSAPYDPPPIDYEPVRPQPERGGGGFMLGVIGATAILALGLGGFFLWRTLQSGASAPVAWEAVDKSNPFALRTYIDAATPGPLRDQARAALDRLEAQSLADARASDTIEAFERFLADFPESSHAIAARGRIAELRASAAPAPLAESEPALDPLTGEPLAPDADVESTSALAPSPTFIPNAPAAPAADAPAAQTPTPLGPPQLGPSPSAAPTQGPVTLGPADLPEAPDAPEEPADANDPVQLN